MVESQNDGSAQIEGQLMKEFRFYEEFWNKRKDVSKGNVFAVMRDDVGMNHSATLAIGPVFYPPNSPVAPTAVCKEYLRKNCKRVSEAH